MGNQLSQENQKYLAAGGAALALALTAYKLQGPSLVEIPSQDKYHLALETGGTACKVGIMKDAKSLKIFRSKIFKTTTPEETVG